MSSLYRLLLGRWALRRSIVDHRAGGARTTVAGYACFEPGSAPLDLNYTETGQLTPPPGFVGAPVTVTQSYIYRCDSGKRSGHADVLFSDGRSFHGLDLYPGGACAVQHECSPDTYRGSYALAPDGSTVRIEWDVSGPAKAYTATTTLEKVTVLSPKAAQRAAAAVAAHFGPDHGTGEAGDGHATPRALAMALVALGRAGALGAAVWADEALGSSGAHAPAAEPQACMGGCRCRDEWGSPQPFVGKAGHVADPASVDAWWTDHWATVGREHTGAPVPRPADDAANVEAMACATVRCGDARDALSCEPPFVHDHAARRSITAAEAATHALRDEVYKPAYAASAVCSVGMRGAACYQRLGWGRYAEDRSLYDAFEQFAGDGDSASAGSERRLAPRTVHLGVDVEAAAGTPIHAPLRGVIHSFADNAAPGDYGPTVILEHSVEIPRAEASDSTDGELPPPRLLTFYTLWGHLSRDSLRDLSPGDVVATGAVIGCIGTSSENGGWPPHVHVQLLLEAGLGGRRGDYPGVCARADWWPHWACLCPDPAWLLQTPHISPRTPGPGLVGAGTGTRTSGQAKCAMAAPQVGAEASPFPGEGTARGRS